MASDDPKITEIRGVNLLPSLTPFERVQVFLDHHGSNESFHGFDKSMIKNDMKLLSAVPGEVVFEMVVKDIHADRAGFFHVGAAALMFDISTTTAIIPSARLGFWDFLGVSRNLNVTYINPAPVGTTLIITSTVVDASKKLAIFKGIAVDKNDGKVICTAEHLKFDAGPPKGKL